MNRKCETARKNMFGTVAAVRTLSTTVPLSKAKTNTLLVLCRSTVTSFGMQLRRPKTADKLEFMAFDPIVQQEVLFKEEKKVKTLRCKPKEANQWWMQPTVIEYPEHFDVADEAVPGKKDANKQK